MNDNSKENKKYPEGHFVGLWTGLGIAMFAGLGVPLSIALDNFAFIGIGPAIGVGVGIAIGQSIEDKKKKEGKIRPLTEDEKKNRKKLLFFTIALLVLGIIAFLGVYLMNK